MEVFKNVKVRLEKLMALVSKKIIFMIFKVDKKLIFYTSCSAVIKPGFEVVDSKKFKNLKITTLL